MPLNVLQLNPDTTQLLVIGPGHISRAFGQCILPLANNIKAFSKHLAVLFDSIYIYI